jgi:hypothetical protein
MSTVTTTLAHIRAAALFVGAKDFRPCLRFIHVEPRAAGGIFIVATDGRRMYVGFDDAGTCSGPCSVSPIKLKGDASHAVTFDGTCAKTNFGELCAAVCAEHGSEAAGGRFPDWQCVVPAGEYECPAGHTLNVKLISEAAAVCKLFGDRYGAVKLSGNGDNECSFIARFGALVPAFLVVMPLRETKVPVGTGVPGWMRIGAD